MSEPVPLNNRPKPQLLLTMIEPNASRLQVDMQKCPTMDYAINMLEQALRTLKNEQANTAAVEFGQRIQQAANEQQAMAALQGGRKQ